MLKACLIFAIVLTVAVADKQPVLVRSSQSTTHLNGNSITNYGAFIKQMLGGFEVGSYQD